MQETAGPILLKRDTNVVGDQIETIVGNTFVKRPLTTYPGPLQNGR